MREPFSIHTEPIWRDRANFIINAQLPEDGRLEQLWCRKVSGDTFEICCIPFFLYDVALADIVRTSERDGRRYLLAGVVTHSGRFVFRVHFDSSMLGNREEVSAWLREHEALFEWSSPSMLAIDARDAAHAQEIADYLHDQEQNGRLMYETGKTA